VGDSGFSRRLVIALALSSMLTPLNSTMLSVVLGPIGAEFDESESLLTQALVTSYLIASIIMQAPSGKLGDRFGHRRVIAWGQALFALGSVGAVVAPSTLTLALSRIVMATGGALIVPSAGALLRLEIPAERRGQAFGAFGASMAFSAAIGPVLGGIITAFASWRATFAVNLLVLPVAIGLAGRGKVVALPAAGPLRFDFVGTVLLGIALTLGVLGANDALFEDRSLAFMGGGVVLLGFVLWERRHPEPVVRLDLFRKPVFLAGGVVVAMHNLAMYALLFELPSAVSRVADVGSHGRGAMLGAMMLAMVFISPISGRLADKFGARRLTVTGSTLALAGMALLMFVGLTKLETLVPPLVLFGLGLGLAASPSQASAISATPRDASGSASAMLATMRYLGGVLGIVVLSLVWSAPDDPASAIVEHEHALQVFAAALLVALAASFVMPREAPGKLG
jgi:MFS family permease